MGHSQVELKFVLSFCFNLCGFGKKKISYLFVCVCVCRCEDAVIHVWRSETARRNQFPPSGGAQGSNVDCQAWWQSLCLLNKCHNKEGGG